MPSAIVNTGAYGRWQVVVDLISQSVAANTSYLRIRGIGYNDGAATTFNSSVAVSITATWSGTVSMSIAAGSSQTMIDQYVTVTHGADGNLSVSYQANLGATGTATMGGPTSVTLPSYALPQIIQAPTAPSGVTVTRTSDTQHAVGWTRNVTTAAPYDSQLVQRWDNVGAVWVTVATVAGAAVSYTDTTTVANRVYQYRVVAINSTGSTVSAASASIQTTPAAPTSASAVKSGSDIVLTFTRNTSAGMTVTHEIYASQSGGAYALLATVGDVGTYTHVAPSTAVTWTYQVRAKSVIGATLTSTWATSNTVVLATPPNPPSGLAPNGVAQNAALATTFTWVHSSPDTAAQTKFQIRHRLVGAGVWTTVTAVVSAVSSWILPAATYANGTSVEWQVATWGTHATASAFSASAVFATSTPPTATINTPANGSTVTTSTLTATWGYFDAEGSAQSEWQARLLNASSVEVEFRSGATSATSTTFATPIANTTNYTLQVRVRDASGQWSAWASSAFTVAYLPPANVTVTAVYNAPSGTTVITLVPDAPVATVTVAASSVTVERSINGGAWVKVAVGLAPTATVLDMTPGTVATNSYRATVYSTTPSSVVMTPVSVVVNEQRWAFLNYGPGFGAVLKFYGAHKVSSNPSVEEATEHFAGRTKSVLMSGEATSLEVAASAILDSRTDASTRDEFEVAAKTPGPKCYRDSTGRRLFARMSGVQTMQSSGVITGLSFTLTEVDYAG